TGRACALTGSLALSTLLPVDRGTDGGFFLWVVIVAALYTLINQLLVSYALSLVSATTFWDELRSTLSGEGTFVWPIMVSFGILTILARRSNPIALAVAVIPLLFLITISHSNQARRDEHRRMSGLYGAAQLMHGATSNEEVVNALQESVEATLGVPRA